MGFSLQSSLLFTKIGVFSSHVILCLHTQLMFVFIEWSYVQHSIDKSYSQMTSALYYKRASICLQNTQCSVTDTDTDIECVYCKPDTAIIFQHVVIYNKTFNSEYILLAHTVALHRTLCYYRHTTDTLCRLAGVVKQRGILTKQSFYLDPYLKP